MALIRPSSIQLRFLKTRETFKVILKESSERSNNNLVKATRKSNGLLSSLFYSNIKYA